MSSSPTSSIHRSRQAFAQLVETTLNQAIQMDAYQRQLFTDLDGQIFALHFSPLPEPIFVSVVDNELFAVSEIRGEADATISAPLPNWLQALPKLDEHTSTEVNINDFELSGDTSAAKLFLKQLAMLEIDWEETLSHFTGDMAAHAIGEGVRGYFGLKKEMFNSAKMTIEEYVKYELDLIPSQSEADDFAEQVSQLAEQVETLAQKIHSLKS